MAREKDYVKLLENWPYEYCHMKKPMERKRLLDTAIEHGIDPKGNEIRLMLWNRRYPNAEKLFSKKQQIVDTYLKAWMDFNFTAERLGSWFMGRQLLRDTKKQLVLMGTEAVKPYGELGEQIFYEELYHFFYSYIKLCEDDGTYGTVIMGLGRLNKESFAFKVAEDFYRICYKVPAGLNLNDEFAILQKAAMEAFYDEFPDYQEIYDDVLENGVK